MSDFLAIWVPSSAYEAKGMPRSSSRRVDSLGVRQRFAEPDVHDDLLEPRHLVRVGVLELLYERRNDLALVAHLEATRARRLRRRLGRGLRIASSRGAFSLRRSNSCGGL